MEATELAGRAVGLILATAAAGSLAACTTLGPNYQRPSLPTPPQFRFAEQTAQAESLADLPWWQVFDDPSLQTLVREAVANNLDLRVAAARVEELRARAGIVKSLLYPTVDGVANYSLVQSTSPDSDSTRQSGTFGFQLAWEWDLFGKVARQHEAALATVLAQEHGRRGVLVTLVGDVASSYFLLRQLDVQLAIARQTLKVNDDTVLYFRNRLDGGVSNRLELDRIQANRAQTAASIPTFEEQIARVENAVSLLLGRPPGPIARDDAKPFETPPPSVPAGLPAPLLERRPDVMEAEQLLVAANADIGAAKALFYPSVGLTAFGGGVAGDLATVIGGTGAAWSAGAGLLQPIFNAGRNRRNLEAVQAQFQQALASYQKAALNGYREVADAIVTIQKLAQVRVERQGAVTVLQDAADLARSRYDSGLASYIEILTADQDLFQQQLQLADTRGAELRARAEFYRALGGGWQPQ
jgi:multidrug efflux system outer membrane protein